MGDLCLTHVFLFVITIHLVCSLEVLIPTGNVSVEYGSPAVEIDCPYELDSEDTDIVVKWYFNGDPSPQFQWIHNLQPEAIGILKERVDLEFEASPNEESKFSSLYLIDPTSEYSGSYKCVISSFGDEKSLSRYLTVYVPADDMNISYEINDDQSITIFCNASGVYPQPKLDLYKSVDGNFDSMLLQEPTISIIEDNSTYSLNLTQTFKRNKLAYSNKFMCSLTIPRTEYLSEVHLIYEPDPTTTSSTTTSRPLLQYHKIDSTTRVSGGGISQVSFVLLSMLCLLNVFGVMTPTVQTV